MAEMTRIDRVSAVVRGDAPDRAPVSFWCHFGADCVHGQAAVDAHLGHVSRFDIDFLKVMNDNPYPSRPEIRSAGDLRTVPVLRGDEAGFSRQFEVLRALASELSGRMLMCTTVFNPWAVLRRMLKPRTGYRHGPPKLHGATDPIDARISALLAEDRGAVGSALEAIGISLARFAQGCIEAGADGIFLSVRDDWVDTDANGTETYDELVRGGDRAILDAASGGRFNMLHVCGVPRDFEAFATYPVHVMNWADRAAGPSIGDVVGGIGPAICGGVDNLSTLPGGTPEAVAQEVADALRQAGDRPMMISAGCTYDPDVVPEANLDAMVRAVRGG